MVISFDGVSVVSPPARSVGPITSNYPELHNPASQHIFEDSVVDVRRANDELPCPDADFAIR